MEKKKILVTSALLYINGLPHLGHVAGCWLPGDIFARFNRIYGNDTIYVSGTDDYGTTSYMSAKELGMEPSAYIKMMNDKMKKIANKLNISFDIFSGTNTDVHTEITCDIFNALYKNGFISEKESKMCYCEHDKIALADRFVYGTCPYCGYDKAYGDQCDNCGKTYDLEELKNPKCSFCGQDAVFKNTKHLYIRLDKLQNNLKKWLDTKKDVFRPYVYNMAMK